MEIPVTLMSSTPTGSSFPAALVVIKASRSFDCCQVVLGRATLKLVSLTAFAMVQSLILVPLTGMNSVAFVLGRL